MGVFTRRIESDRSSFFVANTLMACFVAMGALGCQSGGPTVSNRTLIAHLPGVDFSGLRPMAQVQTVHAACSLPSKWTALVCQTNPLYTNQQWKSPSGYTGAGIIYARLPLPLSANTLLWFARLQYSKSGDGGHAVGQWTDSLGRPWFEAESEKYHVRGYAVTSGCSAWIVYFGYKINRPPNADELNLAARCVDTVLPQTGEQISSLTPAVADAKSSNTSSKG